MGELAKDERTLFVGQAVAYRGQAAFDTFREVPMEKRIEMPVCEDFQMGFCHGLALQGFVPISFYPRWDFLIIAANQLLNHLDKAPMMGWSSKVIVRTAVGRTKPLDPGPQHCQDYSIPMRQMLRTMRVFDLYRAADVVPTYREALAMERSCIVVERMEEY